ncbi:MAG TPA: molybdopterin-synthase adenylyltransferase MoeB, partial [Gemmatimonadaceae bacterium]|nr:molybdopterin-synthase adenylyltransferase MoeB [Gemmatimonadaceae bacterium]
PPPPPPDPLFAPAYYSLMPLTAPELRRYSRHLSLPNVGVEGQERLRAASVLLVGAGGLGSPAALYLAAAGVGRLGLVDFDRVDVTNLQRQVLHGTRDIGRKKVESARDRLADLNPHVALDVYDTTLTSANAMEIVARYDVVVDGTDNFQTRYLTNDACVILGKPNVYGSVSRFEGQASVFATPDGPCYRCLFREPPPPGLVQNCEQAGVFGVLPGLMGMIQATETVKLILGVGEPLVGRLLLVDALRMSFRTIQLRRDPECPACGTREIRELIDYEEFCGTKNDGDGGRGMNEADDEAGGVREITVRQLAARLASGSGGADFDLVDVREPYEHAIARLPGARLVPMRTLPAAAPSLDPAREIVLYCHHGMRSAAAAEYLQGLGFRNVWNLAGGIDAWSDEVDPGVAKY